MKKPVRSLFPIWKLAFANILLKLLKATSKSRSILCSTKIAETKGNGVDGNLFRPFSVAIHVFALRASGPPRPFEIDVRHAAGNQFGTRSGYHGHPESHMKTDGYALK